MTRQMQEVHGTVTALSSSVGDQRRAVQHLQSTVPSLVQRAEVSLVCSFHSNWEDASQAHQHRVAVNLTLALVKSLKACICQQ